MWLCENISVYIAPKFESENDSQIVYKGLFLCMDIFALDFQQYLKSVTIKWNFQMLHASFIAYI